MWKKTSTQLIEYRKVELALQRAFIPNSSLFWYGNVLCRLQKEKPGQQDNPRTFSLQYILSTRCIKAARVAEISWEWPINV